jgi:hypothetical protein
MTAVPAEERNSGPPAAESARIAADRDHRGEDRRESAAGYDQPPERRARRGHASRGHAPQGKEVPPLRLDTEPPVARDIEHDQGLGRRQARERTAVRGPNWLGEAEEVQPDRPELPSGRIEDAQDATLRPHVVGDRQEVSVRLPRHPRELRGGALLCERRSRASRRARAPGPRRCFPIGPRTRARRLPTKAARRARAVEIRAGKSDASCLASRSCRGRPSGRRLSSIVEPSEEYASDAPSGESAAQHPVPTVVHPDGREERERPDRAAVGDGRDAVRDVEGRVGLRRSDPERRSRARRLAAGGDPVHTDDAVSVAREQVDAARRIRRRRMRDGVRRGSGPFRAPPPGPPSRRGA